MTIQCKPHHTTQKKAMSSFNYDFNQTNPYANKSPQSPTYLTIAYLLYAIGSLSIIMPIIGLIIVYIKRSDWAGSIYYNHACFLIKTFWATIILSIIGGILTIALIGYLILLATAIWYLFRVIAGLIRLLDKRTVTATGWFI